MLDSEKNRIAIVMSTENLLLNAYRVLLNGACFNPKIYNFLEIPPPHPHVIFPCANTGMPLQLLIDTEYCLVDEGYGTMCICVMDLAQKGHVVSYAIVNKEDADAHEFCLREVKRVVEELVAKYEGKAV
jgi:hypothetical protein